MRPGKVHPLHATTPEHLARERDASEQLLERELVLAEVSADLISIVSTSPGRGLHQHAQDLNADLLVVGSCSHGVFGRVIVGDDTRAAVNGAPCAVAIAARGYSEYPAPIARIGVGYNGSRESEAALDLARTLAASTRATVDALEVVSIPSYGLFGAAGDSMDLMLTEANNCTKELPAALGDKVDLLVVGSRSHGSALRLVLGSTCDYLERHARCSLLVLPRLAIDRATNSRDHAERASLAA